MKMETKITDPMDPLVLIHEELVRFNNLANSIGLLEPIKTELRELISVLRDIDDSLGSISTLTSCNGETLEGISAAVSASASNVDIKGINDSLSDLVADNMVDDLRTLVAAAAARVRNAVVATPGPAQCPRCGSAVQHEPGYWHCAADDSAACGWRSYELERSHGS